MNLEALREFCLQFPGATEQVQWGADLLFKVGGKMFAITGLEGPFHLSLKTTPEMFAELIQRPEVAPAAYLGRHHWIAIHSETAVPAREFKELITLSYELVRAKLPKNVLKSLG